MGYTSKITNVFQNIVILKAMYNSVKSCVRWGANLSQFFECPQGVKQGCLFSPLILSLLISEVAEYVRKNGKHGIQLLPSLEEIFLLLFADDIVLVSSTPSGLQNQINNLEKASNSLGLTMNLDKTKVMIFRKGGHIGAGEKRKKWSSNSACEEYASKAKGKILDLMKTMWCLNTTVFFNFLMPKLNPCFCMLQEFGAHRDSVLLSQLICLHAKDC